MTRLTLVLALVALACSEDHIPPPPRTDAGPAPGDCTDSATRTAACGMCGTRTETCRAGAWDTSGACTAEGVCLPGTEESRDADRCATETRSCSASCMWSDWGPGTPPGECTPGDETWDNSGCDPGLLRKPVCNDACAWSKPPCMDHCGGMRRVGGDDEEVCVPSGFFVRGDEMFDDARPVAEVYMDAYYIDRYPVTVRRIRACEAAGVIECRIMIQPPQTSERPDARPWDTFPVWGNERRRAEAFCQWDGGRHLVTEAEWEKAVRGPAPRWSAFLWGDTLDCVRERDETICPPLDYYGNTIEYDGWPASRTLYGAELLVSPLSHVVADTYDPSFYSRPESLRNPRFGNPLEDGSTVWRGNYTGGIFGSGRVGFRLRNADGLSVFRCAREVTE